MAHRTSILGNRFTCPHHPSPMPPAMLQKLREHSHADAALPLTYIHEINCRTPNTTA